MNANKEIKDFFKNTFSKIDSTLFSQNNQNSNQSSQSNQTQSQNQILEQDKPIYDDDLNVSVVLVANRELDSILQNIDDIKEINEAIGNMLDNQTDTIKKIDNNVDETDNNIIKSEKELKLAMRYKNDGIINVVGVTGGALTGSIFGPAGAVVGATIGLSSALIINVVRKHV